MMADFYALREEELRLYDNLSPFVEFGLVFEKTKEKENTMVSAAICRVQFIRLPAI